MIRDVVKVAMLERPRQFAIDYADGKSYIYESKDARMFYFILIVIINTLCLEC